MNTVMNNTLFENDACLVINKLCGEDGQKSLLPLRPVHRLDTPASGCLLLAKTQEAAAFLSAAFASVEPERPVEKKYWAIVENVKNTENTEKPRNGFPITGEWQEAVHWISFAAKQNKSFAHNEERPHTKKALLRWRLLGAGDRYLFLEAELITGRHHQIRAQLAALGFPIKGDLKYGARRSEKTGGIRLHAHSLRFPNPLTPESSIFVEAPPPHIDSGESLDSLWEAFLRVVKNIPSNVAYLAP
jgi:23S rRNA pseudouridine1911/1915/1917 synthase